MLLVLELLAAFMGDALARGSVEWTLNKCSSIRCATCDCHHMTSWDVV